MRKTEPSNRTRLLMAKQRKPGKNRAREAIPPAAPNRRDVLKLMRNGAFGVAAVGGVGYWITGSFKAYAAAHDLSRVGQGAPTIVQIHDPQCPSCTALQKQTRSALKAFNACGLLYLIADINTDEGASFAAKYGVPHVTFLLFYGQGDMQFTINGVHNRRQLEALFAERKAVSQA